MTEAAPALFYLGCAALLIAVVLLRLSARMRTGFFIAMISAAIAGGEGQQVEHDRTQIIALKLN